jgi:probable HAF family extracellular repeat protein
VTETEEPQCYVICSFGFAINDAGDVAGGFEGVSRDINPAVWKADGTILGVWGIGAEQSARGINDADEVVGGSGPGQYCGFFQEPWLFHNGATTELVLPLAEEPLGGFAAAINNRGEVVGTANLRSCGHFVEGKFHSFLYRNGRTHDLGTLPGEPASQALAVNEHGLIVGAAVAEEVEIPGLPSYFKRWIEHAFRRPPGGKLRDLGTLPGAEESIARAVNDHRVIVGESGDRAFIYRHGAMTDLNTLLPPGSEWVLTKATGINDAGEICGTGLYKGVQRAFLMTPKGKHA